MPALNEDCILDFLDGRLAPGDEEELLHTLAVSPERRQLLREHLKLRELTSTIAKHERFHVPEHVTGQLFATLGTLGFTAPASTEAILTNAPQLVKQREDDRKPVAAAWRVRFSSLVTACLVSFMLGIGAFYVFGSDFGVRTLSDQRNLSKNGTRSHSLAARSAEVPSLHEQFDAASAHLSASRLNVQPVVSLRSTVGTFPFYRDANPGTMPEPVLASNEPVLQEAAPISCTAARDTHLDPTSSLPKFSTLQVQPYWGAALPSPLQDQKGTISVRFGSGRAPGNTTMAFSSLSELKFTWTIWNYIVGSASLGQLMSYERKAQIAPQNGAWVISTAPQLSSIPVIGAELGMTLDPLDIPLEASGGVMYDGGGNRYFRGGLFAHFEPLAALSVGVGIEGLLYKHDISGDVKNKLMVFRDFSPTVASGTPNKETSGFIGPSVEVGWHF
ncbi:MAG TPA: hypothetical protein VG537_04325 [Candidatus Kapabacteria bacterium]|jgi:anti-sigma factor RsiW|nr:hypothetical protein [Candidatus Kapabacteria bacterium]